MTYSYKQFFRQIYESAPPKYACTATDAASFLIWKDKSRDRLRELLGLSRLEQFIADSAPYSREAELISTFQEDGYTRYKLKIHCRMFSCLFTCWFQTDFRIPGPIRP